MGLWSRLIGLNWDLLFGSLHRIYYWSFLHRSGPSGPKLCLTFCTDIRLKLIIFLLHNFGTSNVFLDHQDGWDGDRGVRGLLVALLPQRTHLSVLRPLLSPTSSWGLHQLAGLRELGVKPVYLRLLKRRVQQGVQASATRPSQLGHVRHVTERANHEDLVLFFL